MGLNEGNGNSGNIVFLSVINTDKGAKWARRVSADTQGATARDAKCGLVHEMYYPSITGYIESVRIVDKGEYGEELEVRMKDDDPDSELVFILQTPFSSEIGKGFICRMENMDSTEPIEIGVCTKGQKRYTFANQLGDKVINPYARRKDDNGELVADKSLPQPKITERRGKKDYDWKDHDDALYDICEEISVGYNWAEDADDFRVSSIERKADEDEGNTPAPEQPAPSAEDDDDVPF